MATEERIGPPLDLEPGIPDPEHMDPETVKRWQEWMEERENRVREAAEKMAKQRRTFIVGSVIVVLLTLPVLVLYLALLIRLFEVIA